MGVSSELVADAKVCAAEAAERSGVRVAEVTELSALQETSELIRRVWRADTQDQVVGPSLLRTYEHSGNYVAGAYRDGRLIGAVVGFFGAGHLHSFVAGVEPGGLGKGVGFALKQHQRAWTLARGVPEVQWTFDPLVLRNAYFNLHKLAGSVTAYLPEFYGTMPDGINRGDLSDRLYLRWRLDSPRVVDAAHGIVAEVDLSSAREAGAVVLLDRVGEAPKSNVDDPRVRHAKTLLVSLPADVEELRDRDPDAALAWRLAVREALADRLAAGWRIAGVSRRGVYVLERTEAAA